MVIHIVAIVQVAHMLVIMINVQKCGQVIRFDVHLEWRVASAVS